MSIYVDHNRDDDLDYHDENDFDHDRDVSDDHDDLQVWELGTSEMWKVDNDEVMVGEGKKDGWAKIEQIIDME